MSTESNDEGLIEIQLEPGGRMETVDDGTNGVAE
jgi:hypothetical protein